MHVAVSASRTKFNKSLLVVIYRQKHSIGQNKSRIESLVVNVSKQLTHENAQGVNRGNKRTSA